jgi:hypothetical protein
MIKPGRSSGDQDKWIALLTEMLEELVLHVLMGVQGSEQAFTTLAKKRREFLRLDRKEKAGTAKDVAGKVLTFIQETESEKGKPISKRLVKLKMFEELGKVKA